ncbi:MAG: AI-2E family transporter, partial [Pseudomonadota bacterium]
MSERFEKRIFWLAGILAFGWLLNILAPVLTPFIAAALLAYVGDPLADRLEKWRVPRSLAVLLVFLLTFLAIAAIVLLVLPLVRAQATALISALPKYISYAQEHWLPFVSNLVGTESGGDDVGLAAFVEKYGSMAGEWGTKVLASIGRSGGALLAALISLFLIPVLTFYLLRDWDLIIERIRKLVPRNKRETVFELAAQSDEVLGAFLRGQFLVMLGLATIYTLGLSVIGLPYAFAIGVVAGLVSFVPYLGFVFGIVLAGLTALNDPSGWLMLVGVVVVFSAGQLIEGSVLTPKLVGDRIGLHPVIVIFAVMAFGQLFGFFGILLALPAAAVLSVIVRYFYRNYLAETEPEAID